MKRPVLNEVELESAKTCKLIITMSPDQWDALLDEGYNCGALLLEIDQNEQPVRAYQRRIEGQAENPFPFDSICGRCITEAEERKAYQLVYKKKRGA